MGFRFDLESFLLKELVKAFTRGDPHRRWGRRFSEPAADQIPYNRAVLTGDYEMTAGPKDPMNFSQVLPWVAGEMDDDGGHDDVKRARGKIEADRVADSECDRGVLLSREADALRVYIHPLDAMGLRDGMGQVSVPAPIIQRFALHRPDRAKDGTVPPPLMPGWSRSLPKTARNTRGDVPADGRSLLVDDFRCHYNRLLSYKARGSWQSVLRYYRLRNLGNAAGLFPGLCGPDTFEGL